MDDHPATIAAIIVAAGSGARFGEGGTPKQYQPLLGKSVLRWSIDAFLAAGIRNIHVVINPEHLPYFEQSVAGLKLPPPIIGGDTRQQSVLRGLETISHIAKPDYVLIHDAARPAITPDMIERICHDMIAAKAAVIPALPVVDTLRRIDADTFKTERRDSLFAVQTPQAFPFAKLLDLHRAHKNDKVTDDAALFEMVGLKIHTIDGVRGNFKITHAQDLAEMEATLSSRYADIRTGQGYDVHKFMPRGDDGRCLMVGGIEIAHDKILEGHSDADVALHAITDALLATICDGDIGMHFSPKDARWKNADSAKFLDHAASLIRNAGGIINHIDVTIICEEPKIGPHRDAIRARIAEILCLPFTRVSVKATTTEGLGFTGRREGMAAQSIVTVRLPFQQPHALAKDIKWAS